MTGVDLWAAPVADNPVRGTVVVPGSKSITNRALILAALSDSPATIVRPLLARDTQLMIAAMAALGTGVTATPDRLLVEPNPLRGPAHIDCGLAGTVMRFVPPVASLATGQISFDGDAAARHRPLNETIETLQDLGVSLSDSDRGTLPFTIAGTGRVTGGEVTLDASRSSQFVSGLLLSGARYDEGVVVHHRGRSLPSLPHIEMTLRMLEKAGVHTTSGLRDLTQATWRIEPGRIHVGTLEVEPDLSNASAFLAAAMVTSGRVTIPGWPTETTQPGDQIRRVFAQMGASVELTAAGLTLTGPDNLFGIDDDLGDIGELAPTIAAVAACAKSSSRLRGIAHLRGHETNRLAALVSEINRLGGNATETEDGLIINPSALRAADLCSYEDHRMATFGAILGLVVPGVRVANIATTGKTLPTFAADWMALVTGSSDAAP